MTGRKRKFVPKPLAAPPQGSKRTRHQASEDTSQTTSGLSGLDWRRTPPPGLGGGGLSSLLLDHRLHQSPSSEPREPLNPKEHMLKLICAVDGNPDAPKITDRKPRQVGDQRIFDISATETLDGFLHKLSDRVGRILGGVLGDWRVSLRVEGPRAKKFKAATLLELEDNEDDESKESR
ncbi:hypothetical protein CF326_g8166 [Tilletia indica]|uniref:Uncharacterized protein n=1 Tax=Tilletia indica TaxID=43049 RepID=A0A177TDP1_9BASI|nr:hypothetical protein CF326_g8166 [Tilletia indica]KAE8239945.1 hypothetical protein A4X13_0g8005 [Tilletia indica]